MLNQVIYNLLCLVFNSLYLCDSSILLRVVIEHLFSGLHNIPLGEYNSSIIDLAIINSAAIDILVCHLVKKKKRKKTIFLTSIYLEVSLPGLRVHYTYLVSFSRYCQIS